MNTSDHFYKGRKVFVTGADGFVGSWLVKDLLSKKAKVVALIRDYKKKSELFVSGDVRKIKVIDGDLQDFNKIKKIVRIHKPDTIFHLAAQTIVHTAYEDPFETFESNIRGTYHVLEASRLNPKIVKRIVVASSDKAYGTQPKLPYLESMSMSGVYPYEVSKSCTDLLAQSYYATYSLAVSIMRCGNIFGGGDLNFNRIVPGTILSYIKNERPIIRSNGKFIRDYLYVKDVCNAFLKIAEHLQSKNLAGEAFNCSYEQPLSVLQMVRKISNVMNCDHLAPKILNKVFGEIEDQYLSSKKIRKMIAWKPNYNLETGLRESIEWYRAHIR